MNRDYFENVQTRQGPDVDAFGLTEKQNALVKSAYQEYKRQISNLRSVQGESSASRNEQGHIKQSQEQPKQPQEQAKLEPVSQSK